MCADAKDQGSLEDFSPRYLATQSTKMSVEEICRGAWSAANSAPIDLLRCIFGNPFRFVVLDDKWLTPTVVSIAHAAYDNRILPAASMDPERLAVLSDALEEAGCDDSDILDHLRSPGPHVRGCWVLDLVLGKQGLHHSC